jgi:hypothetical protein
VHLESESKPSGESKDQTALPRFSDWQGSSAGSFLNAVSTSQIVRDGPNLLLFRPVNGPVFSISPSGEVHIHKLKIDGDYHLFTVKPTPSVWIVELTHSVTQSKTLEFSTYAFDPESGDPLREYFFPTVLGWGLGCTDGNEFTFVKANEETSTLELVKLHS